MNLKDFLGTITDNVKTLKNKANALLSDEVHNLAITGLSRSGKSMFFTSLIIQLEMRNSGSIEQALPTLPLLKSLPLDLVQGFKIRALPNEAKFPIRDCVLALEQQNWPEATDQIYGFELIIDLLKTNTVSKLLGDQKQVIFRFYDYPGEWLSDLPLLDLDYIHWCHQVTAQQTTEPQKSLAKTWLAFLEHFNFDAPPTLETLNELVGAYRDYLIQAKSQGISMLQPGGLLLPPKGYEWQDIGFVPLPAKVTCDLKHPWLKKMTQNYIDYQQAWLEPLRENYFKNYDSQIVLVDLFEGLRHSKQHLQQLKEALSNIASSLVNQQNWIQQIKKLVPFKGTQPKVAFVATKVDLIPRVERQNLLYLLKDVSSGAAAKFENSDVQLDFFLLSSIKVTQEVDQKIYYLNSEQETRLYHPEPLPRKIADLEQGEKYLTPKAIPSKNYQDQIRQSENIDKLLEYMMKGLKK